MPTLTFEQRRELVTLLIDRVVVDDEKVEIRYVIPTSPAGEEKLFCHLRSDYLRIVQYFFDLQAQNALRVLMIRGCFGFSWAQIGVAEL